MKLSSPKKINSILSSYTSESGFTLVELLVVIVIIAILATVLLVVVNPVEQLERGRDAGRISVNTQIGKAWQSWYTAQGGASIYPAAQSGWVAKTLLVTHDLGGQTTTPANTPACGTATNQDSATDVVCYAQLTDTTAGDDFVVWTNLESTTEASKASCTTGTKQVAVVFFGSKPQAQLDCLQTATSVPAANDPLVSP